VIGDVVLCARPGCTDEDGGHPYPAHVAGGRCLVAGCDCAGFLWVDPAGPASSYRRPPERPAT